MPIYPRWLTRKGPAATTPGERIYAIGDVHGCYDLLRALLDRIEEHSEALPAPQSLHIILLGDVVDRGPESAKVLGFLRNLQQRASSVIVLQGNHEEMMVRAYEGQPHVLHPWLRVGGRDTLRSFGIEPAFGDVDERDLVKAMHGAIDPESIEWLRRLPLTARSGDYYFCHAGIRPGVSLKRQKRRDLLWIGDDFLFDSREHGAVIVHGHTVTSEVEMLNNRIGVDTGAYDSGILSAVYLEGTARAVIATS